MIKRIMVNAFSNITAWVISLLLLIPLYILVVNSFKTQGEALTMSVKLPTSLHLENYLVVISRGKLVTAFFNSSLYSILAIVIGIVTSSMAAFVLARRKNMISRIIYFFIILGITMPLNFVSLMKIMQVTGLLDSQLGMCLLYPAMQTSFSVFLIYGFVSKVPKELDEAAVIDGCSSFRLFFSIVFPLLKPVLVTVCILNFMGVWNDFISATYLLKSSDKWPMTLAVYSFFGMYIKEWNLVAADIVLTSFPVVLIYLLGQRYIVAGMTAGAVKG